MVNELNLKCDTFIKVLIINLYITFHTGLQPHFRQWDQVLVLSQGQELVLDFCYMNT